MRRSAPILDVKDWLCGVFYPDRLNKRSHIADLVRIYTVVLFYRGPPAEHVVVREVGATRRVTSTEPSLRRSCMVRTSYARIIHSFFVTAAVAVLLLPPIITGGFTAFAQGPAAGEQPKY